MTAQENDILSKKINGINGRVLIFLVGAITSAIGVYFKLDNKISLLQYQSEQIQKDNEQIRKDVNDIKAILMQPAPSGGRYGAITRN